MSGSLLLILLIVFMIYQNIGEAKARETMQRYRVHSGFGRRLDATLFFAAVSYGCVNFRFSCGSQGQYPKGFRLFPEIPGTRAQLR